MISPFAIFFQEKETTKQSDDKAKMMIRRRVYNSSSSSLHAPNWWTKRSIGKVDTSAVDSTSTTEWSPSLFYHFWNCLRQNFSISPKSCRLGEYDKTRTYRSKNYLSRKGIYSQNTEIISSGWRDIFRRFVINDRLFWMKNHLEKFRQLFPVIHRTVENTFEMQNACTSCYVLMAIRFGSP